MTDDRKEFEAWISAPPFEKDIARNADDSAWPGNYRHYKVQLAWDAWLDSRAALSADLAAARAECERLREFCERLLVIHEDRSPATAAAIVESGRAALSPPAGEANGGAG